MTANELADELQACFTKADWEHVDEAATMLRQQQAEIEALQKQMYFKDYYEELPNTPVDLLRKEQEK